MKHDPANTIIKFLGGAKFVASIIGKHPSRVYRWTLGTDRTEGQGGLVPSRDQVKLLNYCQKHNIDLRPEDFFKAERLKSKLRNSHSNNERAA